MTAATSLGFTWGLAHSICSDCSRTYLHGRILNKKVAAIALSSISLTNSTVLALILRFFITSGDYQIISTYRRENLRKNQAIGLSFNLATLKCSCKESILLLQRKNQPTSIFPQGRVFVISDQCFPPAFPVADHFMRLMDIFKIPQGSIILISSVSRLVMAGLEAYMADMADVLGQIKSRLGGVVEAFPIGLRLLGGCEDQSLNRTVFDSCLWLKSIQGYLFMGYTNAGIFTILVEGSGGTQPAYRAHHRLPVALELSCFKMYPALDTPDWEKR